MKVVVQGKDKYKSAKDLDDNYARDGLGERPFQDFDQGVAANERPSTAAGYSRR